MRVYVGVDWSSKEIECATATDAATPRSIRGAKRTRGDVLGLMKRVRERHPDTTEVHFFIESGAPGWVEILDQAGALVHVVDAKQAKKFGESWCSSGAKSDPGDACVMANLGRERCERLPIWTPPSSTSVQLTELAWLHDRRSQASRAERQRLRSKLRESFPELEAVLTNLSSRWVHHLLRAIPTRWHAARLTRASFDELMRGSGARQTSLDAVWHAICAVDAGRLSEDTAATLAFVVCDLIETVETLETSLKQIEVRLDATTADVVERELLESVDGIGVNLANRLLQLAFDGATPDDRDTASIKLGASPVFQGSGKTKMGTPKGFTSMRRSAPPRGRATVYLLGRLASQHLAWARARYAWDMKHGKKPAQSYRIIARSLLRILTAMLQNGQPYDDAHYVSKLKERGLPWAQSL